MKKHIRNLIITTLIVVLTLGSCLTAYAADSTTPPEKTLHLYR